jgi:hypothetical protein
MSPNHSPDDFQNLWKSQANEPLSFSAEEIRRASGRFAHRISRRNLREYAAGALVIPAFIYFLIHFDVFLLRLGSALIIAGVLIVLAQLHKRASAKTLPQEIDAASCIEFHRSELARQRDLLLSVWKWYLLPLAPGFAVFVAGQYQAVVAQPKFHAQLGSFRLQLGIYLAACALFCVVVVRINRSAARRLQAQIDELDALPRMTRPPNEPQI